MFEFKNWKERKPSIKAIIHPKFHTLRNWDDLSHEEKVHIWDHIYYIFWFENSRNFTWYKTHSYDKQKYLDIVKRSIDFFNYDNKVMRYCPLWTIHGDVDSALKDFWSIYENQKADVLFELLSYFAKFLIKHSKDNNRYLERKTDETDSDYNRRLINYNYQIFDSKAYVFNEVLEQYWVNIKLTRIGFVHRQEKIVEKELVEPIIWILSDSSFDKVNKDFQSALNDFRENKYPESITKFIAWLEEYIQICIWDDSKKLSQWIEEWMNKWIFPSDEFTRKIFKNTDSILSEMRRKYWIAHSPDDIPHHKDVQIVMNLIFVFIQHCE